jgi:hypothetical protein
MHLIHSMLGALFAVLSLLALGFCLALGVVRYASGQPYRRQALWNSAPAFSVTPYDPNAETHKGGRITRLADAAIAQRWSLVTNGATLGKTIKVNPTAGANPIGVIDDTTDTLNGDLTIPVNINLLGGADRTLKVYINSAVTAGDYLIQDTATAGAAMTDPLTAGTKVFQIGQALQSGVAGQVIEFMPMPNFASH